MIPWQWLAACIALLSLAAADVSAGAERGTATYRSPVESYGHFALGRPHEYAQLEVRTEAGSTMTLTLPGGQVFEDLAPRRVMWSATSGIEWLTIISQPGQGARLALIGVQDGQLAITAQSAPIGTPNRWLNPVGVADLDGDGQTEVAAVITPHIGGTLKVYRRQGPALVEVAARFGYSNHVYGSPELGLSMVIEVAGQARLLVPDQARRSLRVLRLEQSALIELNACTLPKPIVGALMNEGSGRVSAGLAAGRRFELPADCLR